ncbi:MAG: type II toxin-antitoxin system RatA family toxin [Burkholderiales bacterium]
MEYSVTQMFDLVEQVEHYPRFLPWCGSTEIHARNSETTLASIEIDYHRVKQSFTTRNVKCAPHSIEIRLERGPFRTLEGLWRFSALGDGACKVEFSLSYEFSSKLLETLIGPVFENIAGTLLESFIQRAEAVYDAKR